MSGAVEPAPAVEPEWARSVDDLRALSRLAAAPLAPMLLRSEDEAGDAAVRDAVAVRTLLARGLVALGVDAEGGATVELAPGLRRQAAALPSPAVIVEVEVQLDDDDLLRHVLVEGEGPDLVLSEREPDVWVVAAAGSALVEEVLARTPLPEAPGTETADPSGARLAVPVATHLLVDQLVTSGADDQVVPALVESGVASEVAEAWAAAVLERESAGAVRIARREADGSFVGGEVRWLEGAGSHWLLELEGDPEAVDEMGDGPDGPEDTLGAVTSVMSEVGPDGVRTAVVELVGGES